MDYYDVAYGVKVLHLNGIVSYFVTSFQLIAKASIIRENKVDMNEK